MEISGEFESPLLDDKDYDFIKNFIACEGNISKMQAVYEDTYKGIKDRLFEIKVKIGVDDMCRGQKDIDLPVNEGESKVIATLKEKIKGAGRVEMPLLRANKSGNPPYFWLSKEKDGFETNKLQNVVFTFEMFDAVVKKANELGGKMYRGDGAIQLSKKLGSPELPLDSIDGFLAINFFNAQVGQTITRRSTYIAGILDWAGIATNNKSDGMGGYISINPLFRE